MKIQRTRGTKGRIMNLDEDMDSDTGPDEFGAGTPMTKQENFVNSVYFSLDEATGRELNRLRRKEGVIPTCKIGCYHCCAQFVLTNTAEAHAIAQYVKREFSIKQIAELRARTLQWHKREKINQGSVLPTNMDEHTALSDAPPYCPMLVNGACIAYPVRPVTCRTHFVCSDPQSCRPSNDAKSIAVDPLSLMSVVTVANPFSLKMRDCIENEGMDFCHSIMLLPQWLAIKMDWDFAISL